jgi:hypothetical protein
MARWLRCATGVGVGALLLGVGIWSWAAIPGGAGGCDNMAGECLRQRQGSAIVATALLCFAGAAASFAVAWAAIRRRGSGLTWVLLGGCGALAIVVLAIDPAHHLNNAYHGWWSFS